MTRQDIDDIIKTICPSDEDFEKPIISPIYLKKELEALALEQEESVPVVRCKDCRHGDPCNDGEIYCEKDIGTIETAVHKPDWFCADGERNGSEHE